jgi:Transposase.
MVVIGVDSHKRTHTVVAVDDAGRKLAERTAAATADGHLDLLGWSRIWPERTWALEDCRNLTRRLEADLLRAGEAVRRVPTKLMAGARRSAREPGKSDPIDALSVARVALREPNLPVARLDGSERELRLLVDYRDVLISVGRRPARRQHFKIRLEGLRRVVSVPAKRRTSPPAQVDAWEADTLPAELLPLGRAGVVIADRARGAEGAGPRPFRPRGHSALEAKALGLSALFWFWPSDGMVQRA